VKHVGEIAARITSIDEVAIPVQQSVISCFAAIANGKLDRVELQQLAEAESGAAEK
jgi:hypothetical protein